MPPAKTADRGSISANGNGQLSESPLEDVVGRLHRLFDVLYERWREESHDARWFPAPSELARAGSGGAPSDRTASRALAKDRVNQEAADEVERAVRRAYCDLADAVAASRGCAVEGCEELARPRGFCELHYP